MKDGPKRKKLYLLLLATTAHTRRIMKIARMVRVITIQSGGRRAEKTTTSITQVGQLYPGMIEFLVM